MDINRFKCQSDDDGLLNLRLSVNVKNAEFEVVVIAQPAEPKRVPDYVQKVRKKYPRAYEPWTAEEEDRVRNLLDQGWTVTHIAQDLGRQSGAVRSRIEKMSLSIDLNPDSSD